MDDGAGNGGVSVEDDAGVLPQSRVPALVEAAATCRDRETRYPHPRLHFEATAGMLTAYLRARGLLREGAVVAWWDWPRMMTLDKLARSMTHPRDRDSLVDRAGYVHAEEMGWEID